MVFMNYENLRLLGNYYEINASSISNIYIESLEYMVNSFGGDIKPHIHSNLFQFLLIENAGGTCSLNDKWADFNNQSLILIPNNVIHSFKFNNNVKGKVLTINSDFFVKLFINISDLFHFFSTPKIINDIPNYVFIKLVHLSSNIFNELYNKSLFSDRLIQNFLEILIINIYRDLASNDSIIVSENLKAVKIFNEYRNLIINNEDKRNDLGFFTSKLNLTIRKLNEACKFVTGKSALNIINTQIVYDAKMLLLYSELSILDIADKLHFANQNYFTRFFKKHTGLTPGEFRKNSLVENNNL